MELTESSRLHPAVDFPAQDRYMTMGFRVDSLDGESLLILCFDRETVSVNLEPETLEIQSSSWKVRQEFLSWPTDRWDWENLKKFLKNTVTASALYHLLKESLAQYLDLAEPVFGLLTAWMVGTYLAHQFAANPSLHILGPN